MEGSILGKQGWKGMQFLTVSLFCICVHACVSNQVSLVLNTQNEERCSAEDNLMLRPYLKLSVLDGISGLPRVKHTFKIHWLCLACGFVVINFFNILIEL